MIKLFIEYKILIGLTLILHLFHFGNGAKAQAYNFNSLSLQDGLPQSQAFSIVFDEKAYAWIGTQGGGLCKYDGKAFKYFTKQDGLISNRIHSLLWHNAQLWVGQVGGVSRLHNNGRIIQNYKLPDNQLIVQDITVYYDDVLLATNKGVYKVDSDSLIHQVDNKSISDVNVYQFFQLNNGELWLCTNSGLLHYTDPFAKLNRAKGLGTNLTQCAVEFQDAWIIGTYENGLKVYKNQKVQYKKDFSVLDNKIILSLFVANENELWVGTMNSGVYVYQADQKSLKNYHTGNGLSGNHIKTIVADQWENIWMGTSGGGVSIFQNSPFMKYNSLSGLNGDYVFSVLNDRDENLWLGTEGKGVMRLNDTSKVLFDEETGFVSEKVKAIFEDSDGDIWFGTEGKGIGVFTKNDSKDTVYAFQNRNGLHGNWVKCFAEDRRKGVIYIGTSDAGIYQIQKSGSFPEEATFKKLSVNSGKIPSRISALLVYRGRLWFAADNGQYGFIQNKGLTLWEEPQRSFRNVVVKNNWVWLGSKDNGILKLTMRKDTIYEKMWMTTGENIPSNNIYQLLWNNNQLWVGTEKGLDQLTIDALGEVTKAEHYGYEEGFEGVETNVNANDADDKGNLWFGTVNGLFVYKGLQPNPKRATPPALHLADFQIVYRSIDSTKYAAYYHEGKLAKKLTLPYDQNHVSFEFKAIHYAYADRIRYRWRLKGLEKNWSPATDINRATYPNLAPGNYTFEVQATIDQNWESQPLTLSFFVDKPYWDKFWFKATYYSVIGVMLLLIGYLIFRRQRKKIKALNEKLQLEKNLLELEQKALRLQMNPHFIFNVLNSIHNLIILNNPDKARYALSKFSKLMRQVLENSREQFVSIEDEVETLKNYVQLERLTGGIEVELIFKIPDDIDTTEKILPPLMLQPFVENAIVHGFKGINYTGEIKIAFCWIKEDVLECRVKDNGVGRASSKALNAQQETYHKSTALKVTQERLANLNKDTSFIPFEIMDQRDENGKPAGTEVIIRLKV